MMLPKISSAYKIASNRATHTVSIVTSRAPFRTEHSHVVGLVQTPGQIYRRHSAESRHPDPQIRHGGTAAAARTAFLSQVARTDCFCLPAPRLDRISLPFPLLHHLQILSSLEPLRRASPRRLLPAVRPTTDSLRPTRLSQALYSPHATTTTVSTTSLALHNAAKMMKIWSMVCHRTLQHQCCGYEAQMANGYTEEEAGGG
jgi:hypothetical protein